MSKASVYEAKTENFIQPILDSMNFELVDVEYVKEGGMNYLRAYIDKEGGITVDDCEVVARQMNEILDREDYIPDSYTFEVSSPGLGRPLKKEKDYVRNMNKEIEIRTYRAINKSKEFYGLLKAYDKDTVTITDEDGKVEIDPETCAFSCYQEKTVVDTVEDPVEEISLADAHKVNGNYQLGDIVRVEVKSKEFGRIATQNAKNVILQKIREEERKVIFDEYNSKEKDVVTGVVQRYIGKNVSINLGKADALLTESEQIKGEVFKPTERIKVYILEVKSTSKGPKILVSRTHPELVKRLFESEVTEVKEGIVEIKAISREAGSRTKIAVWSNDPNVDPVGACVGMNGARVNAIVNELRGEKIDIITWDENPAILIQNALSPAKVISVIADADEKSAKVVVPDYQLSLAIGKEGQNARLAARLTGFKIDIKSETQARESGDFMDYENDYEEDDYDDDYDYSDDELAENERLADTEQADVQR